MCGEGVVFIFGGLGLPCLVSATGFNCSQFAMRAYGCAQEWYILRLRHDALGVESGFVRQADFCIVSER